MATSTQQRHRTVGVDVGGIVVGGGAPIVVQSMTNTDTADVEGDRAPGGCAGRGPVLSSCASRSTATRLRRQCRISGILGRERVTGEVRAIPIAIPGFGGSGAAYAARRCLALCSLLARPGHATSIRCWGRARCGAPSVTNLLITGYPISVIQGRRRVRVGRLAAAVLGGTVGGVRVGAVTALTVVIALVELVVGGGGVVVVARSSSSSRSSSGGRGGVVVVV